jgi:hypothetical protein
MSIACDKHRENPVKGYSACPGCEVERLTREREQLRAELDALRGKEAVARVACVPGTEWKSLDFFTELQEIPTGTHLYAAPIAKEQGEWIACAERLPERGQHIVVRREGKAPFAGAYSPLDGMHRCLDRWSGKWWEFSMWLPAPQEAEQESERFSFAAAPSRQD